MQLPSCKSCPRSMFAAKDVDASKIKPVISRKMSCFILLLVNLTLLNVQFVQVLVDVNRKKQSKSDRVLRCLSFPHIA